MYVCVCSIGIQRTKCIMHPSVKKQHLCSTSDVNSQYVMVEYRPALYLCLIPLVLCVSIETLCTNQSGILLLYISILLAYHNNKQVSLERH